MTSKFVCLQKERIENCFVGTQFKKDGCSKSEKDLVLYYQLTMEIIEAKSLKPFVEKARDGMDVALLTGNADMFREAVQKQEALEEKENRVKKLECGLGILGLECIQKRTMALEEGKKLTVSEKGQTIRAQIEMLSFSILQRTKNISRLTGIYTDYILYIQIYRYIDIYMCVCVIRM